MVKKLTPQELEAIAQAVLDKIPGLAVFVDNAGALAGGKVAGDLYRTSTGSVQVVY